LRTPSWFYGKKSGIYEEVRVQRDDEVEKETSGLDEQPKVVPGASGIEVRATRRWRFQHKPSSKIELEDGKVNVSVPYWIVGLVGLGLIFSLLLVYRLGQHFSPAKQVPTAQKTLADAPPAGKLEDIKKSPIRQDVLPIQQGTQGGPVRAEMKLPQAKAQPGQSAKAAFDLMVESQRAGSAVAQKKAAVASGMCWIMCGHDNSRELRPVQEYFAKRGIVTKIGRFNNRYVLYTETGFSSIKSAEAIKLKNRIARLGLHYNSEKKKGAASFSADTFKSAYAVNRKRISSIGP